MLSYRRKRNHYNKFTFKVKISDEYHDIVMDWYEYGFGRGYSSEQLFNQLESITGIPKKYTEKVRLYNLEDIQWHKYIFNDSNLFNGGIRTMIADAGGLFHLSYVAYYGLQPNIWYLLVPERLVPEGTCNEFFCQYKYTKVHLNKLKDMFDNDQFRALSQQTSSYDEKIELFKQFNVIQYFEHTCDFEYTHQNEGMRRYDFQRYLYLRTRG